MSEAVVGDDVYGEDPTINRLEKRAAEIFDREAALFVPSGTMGNQIAIKLHTHHGQEVICEERCHVFEYEMAMMAHFSGVIPRTVWAQDGMLTWEQVKSKIRAKNYDDAKTGMVSLENTHNMAGGTTIPPGIFDELCGQLHAVGLPVHLDGARVFNASVALGIPVAQLTAKADTVMFCLSKGLGAPVGSMIVGTREFIERARLYRKMFGGGMRQVGVLAAAGLIALEKSPARLREDHENAKHLANEIAKIAGLKIDPAAVRSNIVIFDCKATGMTAVEFCDALYPKGIWAQDTAPYSVRLVTHWNVDRAGMDRALTELRVVAQKHDGRGA
jgi:threonine aldolase